MADVQDGNEARGIKLFGTTISPHNYKHKITETTTDQDSTKSLLDYKTQKKRRKSAVDQDSTKSLTDSKALEKRAKITTDQDPSKSIANSKRTKASTDQDSTKSLSDSITLGKTLKVITDQDSTKSLSDSDAMEKKPDKIVPCPRCKSMDTKFCYFNNYNVNQPRHFCRGCQRYWTAGGALRDVPVGAGRRKNKPVCLSSDRFPESCFFEASSGGQQFHFNAMVDEHLRWP